MLFIRRLIWDAGNVAHIARHDVSQEEVEEVCEGEFIHRETYKGRLLIIGPTQTGRILAIVLAPEGEDVYYVVTARPADRRERRDYGRDKGVR